MTATTPHGTVQHGTYYEQHQILPLSRMAEAYTWYVETFADINRRAALRHLMTEVEFIDVMQNPLVDKHLVLDDETGEIDGLGACTNQLGEVPLISTEYFATRWPDHFHDARIRFVLFIGVRQGGNRMSFQRILRGMQQGDASNLWFMDVCKVNLHGIAAAARHHLAPINPQGMWIEEADTQTFLLMRFDGRTGVDE